VRRLGRGLLVVVAFALPAAADDIFLKGAGKVSGRILEQTDAAVTVEVSGGTMVVPRQRIDRIDAKRSPVEEYAERAAKLGRDDAAGWKELALYASDNEMYTKAREAWERVLALTPGDPEANAALGRVLVGGNWVSEADGYRARGYVQFEGEWMTPAEQQRILQERAAGRGQQAQRDAEKKTREAEEERARAQAKAQAEQESEGGLPLWWGGWGAGPTYWPSRPVNRPPRATQLPARVR
jgi:hypothetical protein